MMTLDTFNLLTREQRQAALIDCCHSRTWAEKLASQGPFTSRQALVEQGQILFTQLAESDWLEAFSGHAKIGDIELLKSKYAGKAASEQGQVLAAGESTIQSLWQLNQQYEQQHGFIFIVCATGKSAEQMLAILTERIHNDRHTELRNAAAEQNKITAIRLTQLIQA